MGTDLFHDKGGTKENRGKFFGKFRRYKETNGNKYI